MRTIGMNVASCACTILLCEYSASIIIYSAQEVFSSLRSHVGLKVLTYMPVRPEQLFFYLKKVT